MSTQYGETGEESTPLLQDTNNGHRPKKEYSILKVRIVYSFVPLFTFSTLTVIDSLMAQYLLNRLAKDAGYLNNTNLEICFVDINSTMYKIVDSLQSQVANLQSNFGYAQSIPAFITCLFVGSFSDYFGRRFMLLLPVFTTLFRTTIITLIIRLDLNLHFMYLANVVDGLAGSWYTLLLALYSLTADTSTTRNDRTFWIYFVTCALTLMGSLINISVGYLIRDYGFFEAELLLLCMTFIGFVVPLLFLPETHVNCPEKKEYNPLFHIKRIFGFYFLYGSKRKRVTYCLGLLLFIIGVANVLSLSSIDALYQMHQPFCWSSTQIGYYSALRGAGATLLGAVFLKVMQRCAPIEIIAMIGLVFQGASNIFEAFLWKSWQFYLVPIIGSPSVPLTSIIRSMLSLLTGPDKQGALFSSIAVFESLIGLVSVVAWNKIYSATVSFMPGFVYLIMAACSFLTLIMFLVYMRVHEKPQPVQHSITITDADVQ